MFPHPGPGACYHPEHFNVFSAHNTLNQANKPMLNRQIALKDRKQPIMQGSVPPKPELGNTDLQGNNTTEKIRKEQKMLRKLPS